MATLRPLVALRPLFASITFIALIALGALRDSKVKYSRGRRTAINYASVGASRAGGSGPHCYSRCRARIAFVALGPLFALLASVALWADWTLRTSSASIAFRALRTGRPRITFRALRTLRASIAGVTFNALRPRIAFIAFRALRAS